MWCKTLFKRILTFIIFPVPETSGAGCRVTFGSKRFGRLVCGSLGILSTCCLDGCGGMQPSLTNRYTNTLIGPQTNLTRLLQVIVFCEGISASMISPLLVVFLFFLFLFYTCTFSFMTYVDVSCFCCYWFMFLVWPCFQVSHYRVKIYTIV